MNGITLCMLFLWAKKRDSDTISRSLAPLPVDIGFSDAALVTAAAI
jgi:hypothetical protein